MDNNTISSDLIRGHINTIILRALYDGDKYGYEICKDIEEKSAGQYELKQPTLYSSLKRLETQGYVTAYWGGVSNGGRRRYFKLTELGKQIAEQNLAEWEYSRTVIDKLISEKDYDLSSPAPMGSVDFNLLKQATTKPPRIRTENDGEEPTAAASAAPPLIFPEDKQSPEERDYKNILSKLLPQAKPVPEQESDPAVRTKSTEAEVCSTPPEPEYVRETPNPAPAPSAPPLPIAERPEADEVYEEPLPKGRIDFSDIVNAAERDGLKIRTSNAKSSAHRDEYYFINPLRFNVSLLVFAVMLIELALFGAAFHKLTPLSLNGYFIVAACIALIPLGFLIAYFVSPSRRVRNRFRLKNAMATACIIMLNCFLAVAVFALVLGANLSNVRELLLYLILPLILLTNFPLSVCFFNLFLKSKKYNAKPE